ncbi:MAG TPA: hypothetical protein VJT09_06930 [Pyrinomonadaceae bacterium]|nr:hypothetical protein [Pyrinomonadaceae bacterium]
MNGAGTTADRALKWLELPETSRLRLARKLEGYFGGTRDEEVFDSLSVDKQQALLILMRRLQDLGMWDTVNRVGNLWGMGGVGMHFSAWPSLESTIGRLDNFSSWFAKHPGTTRGFIERGTGRRPSLHVLYTEGEGHRGWEAHFDLYNPWTSPVNAWRHLLHEKIRHETPDWRVIGGSLGYLIDPAHRVGR